MSPCVVLDAEALTALAGPPGRRSLEVRAALRAAARLHREVVVPSVILAEEASWLPPGRARSIWPTPTSWL
jgi:hypothetical protein